MRAGSTYLFTGKYLRQGGVRALFQDGMKVMPRWNLRLENGAEICTQKIFLHFLHSIKINNEKVRYGKNWSFIIIWMHLLNLQNV